MMRTDTPVTRAFWRLTDLARDEGAWQANRFALAWLAAGRMVSTGNAPAIISIDKLADLAVWSVLAEAGFPSDGLDAIASTSAFGAAQGQARRGAAAAIVAELDREIGRRPWDVLPCLESARTRQGPEMEGTVVPELAMLLMDLVGESHDGELWIPFDVCGQLTVEALRRGWHVLTASPMQAWPLLKALLLIIEGGQPQHPRVRDEVERDPDGRPIGRATHALVVPPINVAVKDSRMAMWDAAGCYGHEQFARSHTWAVHEFVNRVDKRAVFVVPPGVLFTKGQEQHLRMYLIHRGGVRNEVEAVISLPPGVFGGTALAGAVLVVNPGGGTETVYMAELSSGRRSLQEAGAIVKDGHSVALARTDGGSGRLVSREEIAANEYSLAPSRYLRRVVDLGTDAVKLGDICEALRPPTVSRESTSFEVAEIGLQDLSSWRPVNHRLGKIVHVKAVPKEQNLVQSGDIVFSIKGTVGKAALMGKAASERPTVVSQSCLALRVDVSKVRPEYLLMYLRSPHGQAQLDGLQVGGSVQHISPSTLLGSFLVPAPLLDEQRAAVEDFERLCQLEEQVVVLEQEMADINYRRWPSHPR